MKKILTICLLLSGMAHASTLSYVFPRAFGSDVLSPYSLSRSTMIKSVWTSSVFYVNANSPIESWITGVTNMAFQNLGSIRAYCFANSILASVPTIQTVGASRAFVFDADDTMYGVDMNTTNIYFSNAILTNECTFAAKFSLNSASAGAAQKSIIAQGPIFQLYIYTNTMYFITRTRSGRPFGSILTGVVYTACATVSTPSDGRTLETFYLNGVEQYSTNRIGSVASNSTPFLLGSTAGSSGFLDGNVFWVYVGNRALVSNEVKSLELLQ